MKLKFAGLTRLALPVSAFLAFLYWYQLAQVPLSSAEVDHYMEKIEGQVVNPGRHDLSALRHFLETDDGKGFYTVNLYKFNDEADYANKGDLSLSGQQAFQRFSKVMLGLLASHASHPIFASDWMDTNVGQWQRLVIVRYRSRRDIADIFASDEFATASIDKWAGLKENQRFLVQGLHLPPLLPPVLAMLVILTLVGWIVSSRKSFRRPLSP